MTAFGPPTTIRIGTRPSPLAVAQAQMVATVIRTSAPQLEVELVYITSEGDRDMRPLGSFASRGVFAGTLEHELRAGSVDIAVHSYKDLPLDAPDDLVVCAVLERADARDALCGCDARSLEELPPGAVIATGSARRTSILRTLRPDLIVREIRGNVGTRLQRSRERGDAACMLASAGLIRLGLADEIAVPLPVDSCVPDAAQGIVAIQVVAGSAWHTQIEWNAITDVDAAWAADIERAVARGLGGGCEQPVGVHVAVRDRCTCHVFHAPAPGEAGRVHAVEVAREDAPEVAASVVLGQLAGTMGAGVIS
jgi:hydroxymethylbilane synthase